MLWSSGLVVSAVLWVNHPRTTTPPGEGTPPPNPYQWAFLIILFGGPLVVLPVLLMVRAIVDGLIGDTDRQQEKYQRAVDEARTQNCKRFVAEATARLNGCTQSGNAQRLILDELIEMYLPTVQVNNLDGSLTSYYWMVDAGWQTAEPKLMLRLSQWCEYPDVTGRRYTTLHWCYHNYRPLG
jgi:hypothetical protein